MIRSLISTKPILILDEPFAALDTLSVQILVEIIEELKKSKTIIVISHSNELFDIVDKILYVNSDGIISSTFDDLRLNNQEFNKLISA